MLRVILTVKISGRKYIGVCSEREGRFSRGNIEGKLSEVDVQIPMHDHKFVTVAVVIWANEINAQTRRCTAYNQKTISSAS